MTGSAIARFFLAVVAFCCGSAAIAVERDARPFTDYTVSTFGPREGAPSQVLGIAQTPDGFLWLASSQGLVRFDGVHFVPDTHATGYISAVAADRTGAVWVAFEFGGIARLKDGRYDELGKGYPAHTTWLIVPDDAGDIWALTSVGVYWRSQGEWRHIGSAEGVPEDAAPRHIGKLADGSIWITGPQGSNQAWIRAPGTTTFASVPARSLWSRIFGVREQDASPAAAAAFEIVLGSILPSFDTGAPGETWHVVDDLGRVRWARDGDKKVLVDEHFPLGSDVNGLTSMLRDREGNLWLGDTDGIVRVSPARLHAVAPRKAMMAPVLATSPAGDVWIGANGGRGIYHEAKGVLSLWRDQPVSIVGFVADPEALWIFHGGDMALAGAGAIEHVRLDGTVIPEPPAPKLVRPVHVVMRDPRGGVLGASPRGFLRFSEGQWTQSAGIEGLSASAPLRIAPGQSGQWWLGYPSGEVVRVQGHAVERFPASVVGLGAIYAIAADGQQTWFGGDAGIGLMANGRMIVPPRGADHPFAGTRGILLTRAGELWVNAARGVFQIQPAGADDLRHGRYPRAGSVWRYDESDGLQGGIVAINSSSTLVQGGDGKVWISRLDGANWFDPDDTVQNRVPAQASLDSVSADGRPLASPEGRVDIAPGVHTLEFAFTAASLSHPELVTFRYRLIGVDPGWQDAGTRRFARYSDLAPGTYRFEVKAFNEDGLGTATPASVSLTVEPTLFQSWWFRVACIVAIVAVLFALHVLRMRYLRRQFTVRMEARHEERDRIARELHDTLLQSMSGMAMKVHAWAETDELDAHEHKRDMRRLAEATRVALRESRTRILDLRTATTGQPGLRDAVMQAVAELALVYPLDVDVPETGKARPLRQEVQDEVLAIAEEALRNAALHAGARAIVVCIHYAADALVVSIADNGPGFPAHVLEGGHVTGHWGLVGMRERAARLQARLAIENAPGGGAQVRLVVPARHAYGESLLRRLARIPQMGNGQGWRQR